MYIYIYIHIYIQKERERERESARRAPPEFPLRGSFLSAHVKRRECSLPRHTHTHTQTHTDTHLFFVDLFLVR